MIRKLKRKFIIINMLLVSLVLLIVFLSIFGATLHRLEAESRQSLSRALNQQKNHPFPAPEIGPKPERTPFDMTPVFCVILDSRREIASVMQNNGTVTEDVLKKAVDGVLSSGRTEGILKDLNLRYETRPEGDGLKIAFADRTNELHSLRSLFLSSLLIGAGGLFAFFLISLFLSAWALRPVEESWERQRQFAADASHELKTPLTVILANTGILLSHPDKTIGSRIKWLEGTREEAARMKKLVEQLLYLAKSDASQIPLIYASFNISDTLISSVLSFEPVAFEAGVTIASHIEPDLTLTGDDEKIKQLIFILLDNACKYAGTDGTVTVSLSRLQEKICLKVNNSGVPIPAQDLPHIFERFYRTDKSRAREGGGFGLGLSIAQSITAAHHGRIQAESSPENGTTFSVLLPNGLVR